MYFSTAKQMEKLDDLAVENGLEIRQMMELAGEAIIPLFRELNIQNDKKVCIVVGKGNKGGDGLSAARHLVNHGYRVAILIVDENLKPDPAHHLEILKKMGLEIFSFNNNAKKIDEADVVIDSLLGYHLQGNPRGDYARAIDLINLSEKFVISYDVPSGVDATTGECLDPCVQASVTLTLALPKKIFQTGSGKEKSGLVYLADIGIPSFLYDEIEKGSRPDFSQNHLIKINHS